MILARSEHGPDTFTVKIEYRFDFGSLNDNEPAGENDELARGFNEPGVFLPVE